MASASRARRSVFAEWSWHRRAARPGNPLADAHRPADQPLRVPCEVRRGHPNGFNWLAIVRDGIRRDLNLECTADRPENPKVPWPRPGSTGSLHPAHQPNIPVPPASIAWADVVDAIMPRRRRSPCRRPTTRLCSHRVCCALPMTCTTAELVSCCQTRNPRAEMSNQKAGQTATLQQNRSVLVSLARVAASRGIRLAAKMRDWLACLDTPFLARSVVQLLITQS